MSIPLSRVVLDPRINSSIVLPRLIHFLCSTRRILPILLRPPITLDHRLFFLFPHRRPTCLRHNNSSFALLFKAIDLLPKDYSDVVVSAATFLELPVASLLHPSQAPSEVMSCSMASLPCAVAYTLNLDFANCLRPRQTGEFLAFPTLARKVLRMVSRPDTLLESFFIHAFLAPTSSAVSSQPLDISSFDLDPFLIALQFLGPPGTPSKSFTTKAYRLLCSPTETPIPSLPPPYSPHSSFSWSKFWHLPLSHSVRNVWYRFLHQKIPHKSLLHRFMPESHPSAACPICSAPAETLHHFIFECPAKLQIWQYVWHTYVDSSSPRIASDFINYTLRTLSVSTTHCPTSKHFAILTLVTTLQTIWYSHWAFVFNDVPFNTTSVLTLVKRNLLRVRQESFLSSGIPHTPLPFFSLED